MNSLDVYNKKVRRKSVQGNAENIEINLPKIKQKIILGSMVSSNKKRISNLSQRAIKKINNVAKKKINIASDNRRSSCLYQFRNNILESENSNSKRHHRKSQELFLAKKHRFFQKYNAAQDNIDVIINKPSVQLNKIENNIKNDIKNAIHNMKKKNTKKRRNNS